MRLRPIVNTFASGVIKDELESRSDIQHYYDGLLLGDNIDIQVPGGAKVRPGQRYRGTCLATTAYGLPFVFSRSAKYLLVFTDLKMQVWKDGVLQTNLNGSGNDFIVSPYTAAQLVNVTVSQAYNTMILFHPDVAQQILFRGSSDTAWTIGAAAFDNVFKDDFADAGSPIPTDHQVNFQFAGADWTEGDRYILELNDFDTPSIHYSTSQAANVRRIHDALLKLPPTGFRSSSIVVTHVLLQAYKVVFSAGSADAYEPLSGYSLTRTGHTIQETSVISTGVSRREPSFSATRGYPVCGAFFGGGLWQSGFRSLPQRFSRSTLGDFFNLELGKGFDDDAIATDLDTDQYNGIRYMHPGRHLVLFTDGGEFYFPQDVITPSDAFPKRQTRFGVTARNVPPVEIDGAVLFVTKNGKTVREFLFTEIEQAYNASSLTPLSGEAVIATDVVSMAGLESFGSDEASRLLCPTEDGMLAALNSKRDQDMAAWTRYTTPGASGAYRQAIAVDDQLYYLVERTVDGVSSLMVEQRDADLRLDCAIAGTFGSPSSTITGLDHLEGETVRPIIDGIVQASKVVSGGQITLDTEGEDTYQVGLEYVPDLKGTGLTVALAGGSDIGLVKNVKAVYVLVKDTLGLKVGLDRSREDGAPEFTPESVPEWLLDITEANTALQGFTGIRKVTLDGNVEQGAFIRMTQDDPLPFHVLGYIALVEVGED